MAEKPVLNIIKVLTASGTPGSGEASASAQGMAEFLALTQVFPVRKEASPSALSYQASDTVLKHAPSNRVQPSSQARLLSEMTDRTSGRMIGERASPFSDALMVALDGFDRAGKASP